MVPPRLVERHLLERANSRIIATQSVINTHIGPPLGTSLFAITATLAFATGSVMFAVAAAALLLPRRLAPDLGDRAAGSSLAIDIRDGWVTSGGTGSCAPSPCRPPPSTSSAPRPEPCSSSSPAVRSV